MSEIMQRLRQMRATRQRVRKDDFELYNGTAGERSLIAEYEVETATFLRMGTALRLAFTAVEEFTTNGTGGDTETFSLSNNIIETPNTDNLVLYDDGVRVQPDAVDYSADTFDYTDADTASTLHAHYVPRDASLIEIERQAPKSQGSVSDVVFDDPTSLLHVRDQNQDPPEFQGDHPLDFAVPKKWKLKIYAEGPVAFEWDDSDTASPQDTVASNAIVSLPVKRADSAVEGLSTAVKRRIIDPDK